MRTPSDDAEYLKFAATLRGQNIPITLIGAGDEMHFGAVTMKVIWPVNSRADAPSRNNDSIVLQLSLGNRKILMTGDVEKSGEAAILNMKTDLGTDVVKVPHHGSRTSSTDGFVSAAHPQLAIISVGRTSVFGHPNIEVVERWQAYGAEVMTTGRRGTITVTTDGSELHVDTFIK